jgi:hypothetical protein
VPKTPNFQCFWYQSSRWIFRGPVRSLATYTFLAAAVQIRQGTAYLTGPLYADSQATVKNIIFTIARIQVIDPNPSFYILLEGTDCLEGLFGDCKTQDHA